MTIRIDLTRQSSDRSGADGRNPLWATTLPDGHFDARNAAETLGFFGSLWHMEDTVP